MSLTLSIWTDSLLGLAAAVAVGATEVVLVLESVAVDVWICSTLAGSSRGKTQGCCCCCYGC